MLEVFIIIVMVIIFLLALRLSKCDNYRINLEPGDVGKVFLVADEIEDSWFYVVVTKRVSFTEVEVEYNVSFSENKELNAGYGMFKSYRIKEVYPVKDIEHKYFNDGFRKRVKELK